MQKGNKTQCLDTLKILKNGVNRAKNIQTKYYLRVKVEDRTGVLASITNVMSQNNISIDSFLQKPRNKGEKHTTLYFTTHLSLEANIKRVMGILENFEFVQNRPFMIRIEE